MQSPSSGISAKTKRRMQKLDSTGKAGCIAGTAGLRADIPKLVKEGMKYGGVGLQSIR